MCGIVGQFNFDGEPVDRRLVSSMTQTLRHRGPDGEGFYFDKHVGLGHRRLSIIDLETGRQPMSNEDGTIWLVEAGRNLRAFVKMLYKQKLVILEIKNKPKSTDLRTYGHKS